MPDLPQEEFIDLGDGVGLVHRHASPEGFGNGEEPFVVHLADFVGQFMQFRQIHMDQTDFQAADSLQQPGFDVPFDGHHFASGLHLGTQGMVGVDEFVERPAGDLDDAVVQGGFEASGGLPGHGVFDFIQGIAGSDLGSHFGNGIPGCLGSQGRRTAHTGVHFDDDVFLTVRVQGILHVAGAFHPQFPHNVDGCSPQHLHFPVRQGLAGCHHDGVTGMYPHRVDVFHVADGDAVVLMVPHHFVFDFFPAGHGPFDQGLTDQGVHQPLGGDVIQLIHVVGDAATGTTQGIGRTHDQGEPHLLGEFLSRIHTFHNGALGNGLMEFFHGFLEQFPVFRLHDAGDLGAQELDIVFLQDAFFIQFDGQVQADLPAQGGQQGIRPFLGDDSFQEFHIQGLHIDPVSNVHIGHDGGRVGVHQHHFQPLFLQGAAGLGTAVVEFRSLTDDDRAGTNDHDFLYIFLLWHNQCPPIILMNRSNRYPLPLGPGDASGWYCTVKVGCFR